MQLSSFPRQRAIWLTMAIAATGVSAPAVSGEPSATKKPWGEYVARCLDTLVEHGTDKYGPEKTPLMMAVLDVHSLESPENPDPLGSMVRLEGRIHRRGERGSNLWYDQPLITTMYEVSQRTGESRYAKAADNYIGYYLKHCHKPNGMLVWGTHIHWDCYRERAAGDGDGAGPHEILIHRAMWEEMYRLDPEMVRREIDLIWENHIHDKKTGNHNRHDDGKVGFDFPFASGTFIQAFAFMHSVTPGDTEYLRRAKLVTDWHWKQRHPETNLAAFEPGNLLLGRPEYRFYGTTFASAVTGPHAARLLDSHHLTADKHFRDVAVAYLTAYNQYGWLEEAQTFVGMVNLDGTITTLKDVPHSHRSQLAGQGKEPDPEYSVPPVGPVDVWPTTMFPLDFPLMTAQSALYAYESTPEEGAPGKAELLEMARRWAKVIEADLPAHTGRTFRHTLIAAMPELQETGGTYAQNYGRAISFFVHLYRATGDQHYLGVAQRIAADAVDKLYVETEVTDASGETRTWGIFRGHPAKPYYEAADGVGLLLYALLELDQPDLPSRSAL